MLYVTGSYGHVDQWGYCNEKDVLTAKINFAGDPSHDYFFYYGGGDDHGNAIAVDTNGNAYITGQTQGNWVTTPDAFQTEGGFPGTAFILKSKHAPIP
jgi:hypothetical protein